jgi:hypothetical protein
VNIDLISFRVFRNWDEHRVARDLSLSLEDYRQLESGMKKITIEVANVLSKMFNAPSYLFLRCADSNNLSIIYQNCNFTNGNGYVNHLYGGEKGCIDGTKCELIQEFKKEILDLRKVNQKLLAMLADLVTVSAQ